MTEVRWPAEERNVLRWGGLAGLLGGLLFLVVFVVVGVFVGADPGGVEGPIARFPAVRAARTVENGLYLLVLVLWIPHHLALHRALRAASPAPALFGSALGVVGLVLLAAGALPHVATLPLAELYHAPAASPEERLALGLVWRATWGVFEALLVAGLVVLPLALLALGAAMRGAPGFGAGLAGLSLALGALGGVAAVVLLIDPGSPVAVVGVVALIVFHLALGWRLVRLGRAPGGAAG